MRPVQRAMLWLLIDRGLMFESSENSSRYRSRSKSGTHKRVRLMWHAHLYKGAKIMRIPIRLLVVLVLTWVADAKSSSAATIAEVLNQQPAFSNFVSLLKSQGLDAELDGTGWFTIFV